MKELLTYKAFAKKYDFPINCIQAAVLCGKLDFHAPIIGAYARIYDNEKAQKFIEEIKQLIADQNQ